LPVSTASASPIIYLGAAALPPVQAAIPATEDPNEMRFSGTVGGDLTRALEAAGVPERQGREYVWLLGKAITLSDGLSVDDRFDLVIERGTDGKPGQLVYAGLDRIARADVELLKWTDGKSVIWVNADGVGGGGDNAMRLPVSGRVTSPFGERFHPILGYRRMHAGMDLAAAYGSPIVAAADGRVISAGWHGGYGRLVAIAHAGGVETMYGHMSRIVAETGSSVRKGQVIGYVGSSGLSTGPHVHYEVLKNGRPVNPVSVKLSGGPGQLEGEKLRQFHDALRALLLLPPKSS
jgi:murein DD-endopeptidase MepM/ murein hydrolase activator NlpD